MVSIMGKKKKKSSTSKRISKGLADYYRKDMLSSGRVSDLKNKKIGRASETVLSAYKKSK